LIRQRHPYAIIRLEVTEFFGQPIRFQLINVKEYPDKKGIETLAYQRQITPSDQGPPGHKLYSGGWYSQPAIDYINNVKKIRIGAAAISEAIEQGRPRES